MQPQSGPAKATPAAPVAQPAQGRHACALSGVCSAWLQAVKNEKLEVTYSYWDGAGHRHTTHVRKGDTVLAFLHTALKQLLPDFRELRRGLHNLSVPCLNHTPLCSLPQPHTAPQAPATWQRCMVVFLQVALGQLLP